METIVAGSFTPSVLLDVAASTGRLEAHGLAVTEVPVKSSAGQFRSLLDGDLDPTAAFMSGQLAVDGDMGLAMKLASRLG